MARRFAPLLLVFVARAASAAPTLPPAPPAVDQTITLPAASAATVSGADSTLVNPAGLGFTGGLEGDYLYQHSVANNRVGNGGYLAYDLKGLALGFSMEWVSFGNNVPSFRRTTYALALGDETLSIGTAFHVYGGSFSQAFDNLTSWDLGIAARPFRFLSVGFSVLDVNGPAFTRFVDLPARFDAGIAIRPGTDRLTLSADLVVNDQSGFDDAAILYAAHWRIIDGLTLFGGVTHYYNLDAVAGSVGLQLDTPHVGVGYAAGADSGFNAMENTIGVRFSSARYPSSFEGAQFAILDLNQLLSSKTSITDLLFGGGGADPYLSTLALLRRAKSDTAISGVVLKFGSVQEGLGSAHVMEMREAIASLRKAGKPVIALLTDADDQDLFLASACNKIYAVPEAALLVNGLSWDTIFLGETLGRIGVRIDVARVGAFKNAPDQLTRSDMSPEQHEAEEAFLKTVYGEYTNAVTAGRKLDKTKFTDALSHGILTPDQAKSMGLIDGIAYPDQLNDLASEVLGRRASTVRDYADWNNFPDRWGSAPCIALVRISGDIVEGKGGSGLDGNVAGSESIIKGIEAARDDDTVRAIVVRVDSPGGSGNASNLIERAMEKAREKKPVVVSMGNTAASGGYYVAVGGDSIWAEPTTLTGSIGVFVIKPDTSGLLEKLSIHDVTLKQGDRADIFNFTKPWSEGEQAAMQGFIDSFYDRFITLVATRRKLDKAAVDKIARGRIWSGADAKQLGLVDNLGSLDDAVRDAKQRAGLDPDERAELEVFGARSSLLPDSLLDTAAHDEVKQTLTDLGLQDAASDTYRALRLAQTPGVVAALPFSYRLR